MYYIPILFESSIHMLGNETINTKDNVETIILRKFNKILLSSFFFSLLHLRFSLQSSSFQKQYNKMKKPRISNFINAR